MRITPKIISVSILALSLSACGAPDPSPPVADEADEVEAPAEADVGAERALDGDGTEELAEDALESDEITEDASEVVEDTVAPKGAPKVEPVAKPEPKPEPKPAPAPVAAASPPPMFAICSACHSVEAGKNGIGPSLAGVGGAKAGHVGSFSYSDGMKGSGLTWNAANLDKFLKNPSGTVPGTSMGYGGLSNDAQRKAVVDYLLGL